MSSNQEELKRTGRELLAGETGGGIQSINDENRTVDVVFFTGIDVPRLDYSTYERYTRRFDPKGADLQFLNNKAPVLDNHNSEGGVDAVKGVVVRAWKEAGKYLATLRFAKTPDADSMWQKIKEGIVTKISMGTDVLSEEELTEKGVKIRVATAWRPFELSMVPIPADFATQTLSADGNASGGTSKTTKEENMETTQPVVPATPPATVPAAPAAPAQLTDEQRNTERLAERKRIGEIEKIGKKAGLTAELIAEHVAGDTTVEKFRVVAIDQMAARDEALPQQRSAHSSGLRDEADTRRELMGQQVSRMMLVRDAKVVEDNPYRGITSILRLAEESVVKQYNLRHLPSREEVVKLAMQATSDFANVLENSARKALVGRYEYAAPTYRLWSKKSTTPDFKTMSRSALSEVPKLLVVAEGSQIQVGTRSDRKETYALATYGRGTCYTRQMLINDDLSAFIDELGQFGIQASRLENKTVYGILNANAALSDSVALFHATHANLGTGVISDTNLDAGFSAMRIQTGMDATSILNLTPKFLIVPAAKEWTARRAVLPTNAGVKAADQNLFAGRLEVIGDAELDGTSTVVWYLAADPNIAPAVEHCFLEGAEGLQMMRTENENGVLGITFRVWEDFAAKAIDHRPMYKSSGA